MTDWRTINARKVNKAVYLLLEQYHRRYGLAVVGIGRPVGTMHFSFYSLALRGDDGSPLFLPEYSKRYFLTIYQGGVGLPLREGDDHLLHPEQDRRGLRSTEMLSWFESHLSFRKFFEDHADRIRDWRRTYHVAESESLLLTWQVMGHVSSRLDLGIETNGRYDSYGNTPSLDAALQSPILRRPKETVHLCGNLTFIDDGAVYFPSGRRMDFWTASEQGRSSLDIAGDIVSMLETEQCR